VVTVPTAPFLTAYERVHNETYEGYLIDLLNELRKYFVFEYEIHTSKDNRYGTISDNGTWSGMVGELLNNETDLVVADFTVTEERMKVIDFSYPFMSTGIGILAKRAPYFLSPGDVEIDDRIAEGGEVYRPMVFYPVASANDLPNQDIVEYGAVRGGSTQAFFKNSQNAVYKKIGEHLQKNNENLPASAGEGFQRVINESGKYVFFMEEASIDYYMGSTCAVTQMGNLINHRSYAIGMRKNFEHKESIDRAILKLQEMNALTRLRNKWFARPTVCDKALDKVYMRNALNLLLTEVKQ
ncbi:glutamate receptor ionotropic, partial [Leptotrombidium deliense]